MFEPRVLTGPALVIIGALFLTIALRLWLVNPINRVFRLGPFVTERGLRAVLNMRILFFAFGMFFLTNGASSMLYWLVAGQDASWPPVAVLGSAAAVFAVWSAVSAIIAAARLWRVK